MYVIIYSEHTSLFSMMATPSAIHMFSVILYVPLYMYMSIYGRSRRLTFSRFKHTFINTINT